MIKIKGGEQMSNTDMLSILVRYIILFLLIIITFIYIYNPNIQFIMFILLLIIIIVGSIFLIKDIFSTTGILDKINKPDVIISITTNSSTFLKIFLGSIGIGIIFKIISLILFLVVFLYGRKQLNASDDSSSKKLSSYNASILNKYLSFFIISTLMILFLLIVIFISYSSIENQIILRNILFFSLSIGIIIFTTLELYYSTIFLKIRQKNGTLYEKE
jgi:hypothetical protein